MLDRREWTDADFVPTEPTELDARGRYEYLLKVIRYWISWNASFTEIEDTLIASGIPRGAAERLVELVIQAVQGRVHPPGAYPEVDVSPAVIEALGFDVPDSSGLPPKTPEPEPVPELAFAEPTDATPAAMARARGAQRTFVIGTLIFVALCVVFVLLFVFAG